MYCAQSAFIDITSQNMHDNEVCKVDIWLILEEVRAHQSVMAWRVVFGVVAAEVVASGVPENI